MCGKVGHEGDNDNRVVQHFQGGGVALKGNGERCKGTPRILSTSGHGGCESIE